MVFIDMEFVDEFLILVYICVDQLQTFPLLVSSLLPVHMHREHGTWVFRGYPPGEADYLNEDYLASVGCAQNIMVFY
jgi:hypothetical protein